MPEGIVIQVNNFKQVRERLKEKMRRLQELKTPLNQISVLLYKSVMKNFEEEGTDKQKWPELSPLTRLIRRHRASKPNKTGKIKILQDTGYLRMSIYPEIGEDYASVGTNVPYAKLHQFGGVSTPSSVLMKHWKTGTKYVMNIKSHNVPARPFLTIRKEFLDKIKAIAKRWMAGD